MNPRKTGGNAMATPDEMARKAEALSRKIGQILHGNDPMTQSAVLADLLSIWLAGHWPPEMREILLADHVELVRKLVPASEKQIFGPEGHPAGRA